MKVFYYMRRSFVSLFLVWMHISKQTEIQLLAFSPIPIQSLCRSSSLSTSILQRQGKVSSVQLFSNRLLSEIEPSSLSLGHVPMSVRRRPPTGTRSSSRQDNLHQATSDDHDTGVIDEKNPFQNVNLTKWYRVVSMLHLGHIALSLINLKFTLRFLHDIGGSVMGAGVMILLSRAAQQKILMQDTWKRLNGLMVLYSTLALGVALMASCLDPPFMLGTGTNFASGYWWTWFLSAYASGSVAVMGYLQGLGQMSKSRFLSETSRLMDEATKVTTSLPRGFDFGSKHQNNNSHSIPSASTSTPLGSFTTLWTIAVLKGSLLWDILQKLIHMVLTSSSNSPLALQAVAFTNLRQFCQLTILGGTLVTANSKNATACQDDDHVQLRTLATLQFLSSYVLGTMAATGIGQASSLVELAKGCWLAVCTVTTIFQGMRQ